MKALLLTPFLFVCAPSSESAAAVYINDAVIDDPAITHSVPPPGDTYGPVLHLIQSPNGFVLIEVNTLTTAYEFQFNHLAIAAYYGLFRVTSGEELTYLNASSKPTLGGVETLTLAIGQSAYIGYWSQHSGEPPSPMDSNDIFGWAKVSVSGATLVVDESASADGGIIVGTVQAIPEPCSALSACAGISVLLRRRRGLATNRG